MVQLPTPPEPTAKTDKAVLRGIVEHVGSGRRQAFADVGELLAFLRADFQGPMQEVER